MLKVSNEAEVPVYTISQRDGEVSPVCSAPLGHGAHQPLPDLVTSYTFTLSDKAWTSSKIPPVLSSVEGMLPHGRHLTLREMTPFSAAKRESLEIFAM